MTSESSMTWASCIISLIKSKQPASNDDCNKWEKVFECALYKREVRWPYVIKGTWAERVEMDIARM